MITVYDNLDRVEIRNELDADMMPFPGGSGNWNDSYYFAFPSNVPKDGLKIKRGGQKWFDTLPDDYLAGVRHDSVTTQHAIGMTDGERSVTIAHRQAFHWIYPGFVSTKMRPAGAAKELPAMFTGKFPLPEATLYSRALRRGNTGRHARPRRNKHSDGRTGTQRAIHLRIRHRRRSASSTRHPPDGSGPHSICR